MKKNVCIKHNGKNVRISDFAFDGKVASGYVHGRKVSGEVFPYVYALKKEGKVTAVSNAKHFLVDHYVTLYGDAPALRAHKSETYRASNRIRNTHIVSLGNGTCIATGEVDGVVVTVKYEGTVTTNHTGEVHEAKPWLRQARKDLLERYDMMQAENAARKLKELRAQYPGLIESLVKELIA